jgi:hypothetical protein
VERAQVTLRRPTRPENTKLDSITTTFTTQAFWDSVIVPDPEGIITAGHDNKTARTVAFRRGEPINAPAFTDMFKHIIANNRAGGWRKLKREG